MADKGKQKPTDSEKAYFPSKKEEALLEVILNPLNRLKNVVDICAMVPCDRSVYYEAFKKPGFLAIYREQSISLTTKAIAPVLNSVVREASRGSYQHAKIVLAMANIYSERKTEDKDSSESYADAFAKLIARLPD